MLQCGAFLSRLVRAEQPCFEIYSHINKNIKYLLWVCVVCRHFVFPRKRIPQLLAALSQNHKELWEFRDTSFTVYEIKVYFCGNRAKPGVTIQEGLGMFCARRAVRIFGRRGPSVALRTSICELHSQIQRRTVLLWSAR